MHQAKDHPYFFTATCLEWKHLLADDRMKEIIIDSLRFLSRQGRVNVFAFCIMANHIHLIWQVLGNHTKEDVQRDFLKYTGQQILKRLREDKSPFTDELFVCAKDRKYQVWERNALSLSLESDHFFFQKLEYIHQNPVAAGICLHAEDYSYSSARFYFRNVVNFEFLEHYHG
jgi:REP element-mobilizing transposase RayT